MRQESHVSIILQSSNKLYGQSFYCVYCKIVSLFFSGDSKILCVMQRQTPFAQ